MKFDDIDLELLNYLTINADEHFTSTMLTKALFSIRNRETLIKKNVTIAYRLKKWLKYGIIGSYSENGITFYRINLQKIKIGESIIKVDGKAISMGDCVILELEPKQYIITYL